MILGHLSNRCDIVSPCLIAALVWLGAATEGWSNEREFLNPYASVNWDEVNQYYANFHTHTVCSDGDFTPHFAIDAYKRMGYHILALTDHDTDTYAARREIIFPWTELNNIYHAMKDHPNVGWRWRDKLYRDISEPWQNRNPNALEMISVPGLEVSRTHHIGSLFNDYPGNTTSEETAFVEIGRRDGLAVLLHPGRYDFSPAWYVYFYERHDHLIGMEVFNQKDRYPGDRVFWDRVLHRTMPERPIWGIANDDMHQNDHLGWNFNVFPLSALTTNAIREAMTSGAFYFYKPKKQKQSPSLHLTRVETTGRRIRLSVDGAVESIQWITHNPDTGQSDVVHEGAIVSLANVPASSVFVRARIKGKYGTAYTQPFGIQSETPRVRPGIPDGTLQEIAGWKAHQDKDAALTLEPAKGTSGTALKASYDLANGVWVAAIKPVGRISKNAVIRFEVRGEGNANSIELKLEDGGGATYGQVLPMKTDDTAWYAMDIPVTELKYWWGGKEALDASDVRLSFAIVKKGDDEGGAGTLYVDNISIQ